MYPLCGLPEGPAGVLTLGEYVCETSSLVDKVTSVAAVW